MITRRTIIDFFSGRSSFVKAIEAIVWCPNMLAMKAELQRRGQWKPNMTFRESYENACHATGLPESEWVSPSSTFDEFAGWVLEHLPAAA